jgi:allantoicase
MSYKIPEKWYVNVGDRVYKEMPYSEVCMHLKVAGKVMGCEIQRTPWGCNVQLHNCNVQLHNCHENGLYYLE